VGGFQPGLVGSQPLEQLVQFDDQNATVGNSYEATLVLTTRDGPGVWEASGLPALSYHLTATLGPVSAAEDRGNFPAVRWLAAAPNPFFDGTRISFALARAGPVSLRIVNARGRLVASLLESHLTAGMHETIWDGRDDQGRPVAAGIYFVRLSTDERVSVEKIVRMH
jgi:hypothetical protein